MKRCKKTEGDFVCVRIADHNGACDLVQREVFDKAMKDNEDAFLRGDLVNGSAVGLLTGTVNKPAGYSVKCTCGRRTPFAHMHAESCAVYQPQLFGRAEHIKPNCMVLDHVGNFDPAVELDKVKAQLKTAGVAVDGLSASEGVKLLIDQLNTLRAATWL